MAITAIILTSAIILVVVIGVLFAHTRAGDILFSGSIGLGAWLKGVLPMTFFLLQEEKHRAKLMKKLGGQPVTQEELDLIRYEMAEKDLALAKKDPRAWLPSGFEVRGVFFEPLGQGYGFKTCLEKDEENLADLWKDPLNEGRRNAYLIGMQRVFTP